jgi:hypothetical protein
VSRPRWLKSGEICGCQVSYKPPSWLGWSLKTRSMIVSDKRQLAAANDRQGIPWNFSQRYTQSLFYKNALIRNEFFNHTKRQCIEFLNHKKQIFILTTKMKSNVVIKKTEKY